jgi:hypothetical protein
VIELAPLSHYRSDKRQRATFSDFAVVQAAHRAPHEQRSPALSHPRRLPAQRQTTLSCPVDVAVVGPQVPRDPSPIRTLDRRIASFGRRIRRAAHARFSLFRVPIPQSTPSHRCPAVLR